MSKIGSTVTYYNAVPNKEKDTIDIFQTVADEKGEMTRELLVSLDIGEAQCLMAEMHEAYIALRPA